jgi:hypothetical protein
VDRANAGTGPRPVLCQRAASLPRARADPARLWATCTVQPGRIGTVDVGCAGTVQLYRDGFGPVTINFFYFLNIFKYLQIQKKLCRIRLNSENYETNFVE